MMFPKEQPWRSEEYRKYIRSLDCCGCGWPAYLGEIEAHHVLTGGTSTKCSDEYLVPLCSFSARKCHRNADKSKTSAEKYLPIAAKLFAAYQGPKP